jgi:uncharacterized protein
LGLKGPRVYLDSCIAIYLIEEHPDHLSNIEKLIATTPDGEFAISDLTVMECLVGPLRSKNQALDEKYRQWFESIIVFPITRSVFAEAAKLRAELPSLRTPDAIHLATAFHFNCDELWTNDERLNKIAPEIVKNVT